MGDGDHMTTPDGTGESGNSEIAGLGGTGGEHDLTGRHGEQFRKLFTGLTHRSSSRMPGGMLGAGRIGGPQATEPGLHGFQHPFIDGCCRSMVEIDTITGHGPTIVD